MKKWAGIILAGGSGSRMGSATPKQFLELAGRPLLWHTLRAFSESPVEQLVLVVPGKKHGMERAGRVSGVRPVEMADAAESYVEHCRREYVGEWGFEKIAAVVEGGAERYDSVYAGLNALRGSGCEIVAIHDGARPLITAERITASCEAAEIYGACVLAVPVKDTIKRADEELCAAETLPRKQLWAVQTPQSFRYELCLSAYDRMMRDPALLRGVTDDAMVLERCTDTRVKLVMGDYQNLKVTTPEDMLAAEVYLRTRKEKGIS